MIKISSPIYDVKRDPQQMNALALAYIGDSIYEVYVRQYVLAQGEIKPHMLHRAATHFVSAKAQADQLDIVYSTLTEMEQSVVRRGRNAKSGTLPKHANPADYHKATAFEALIGYLYLRGEERRLHELIESAMLTYTQQRAEGGVSEWKK